MGINDARHVASDRSQVAVLHDGVNVHHAPDVVVIDHFHLVGALDGRDIRQYRWSVRGGGIDRCILKIAKRLNVVLRRLSYQVVAHAVLPVQEEHWRNLEASAQRCSSILLATSRSV